MSFLRTSTFLVVMMLGFAFSALAQVHGEVGTRIDELLTRYSQYGMSGTVLVVKNGNVVIRKAYGLADREARRPNTVGTLYDVGSIAKTFTAASILQLEMAGKLSTSDLVSKHLGDLPADKANITIHHLLTHSAGLKLDAADAAIYPLTPPGEYVQKIRESQLLSPPGEKYSYSNVGYMMLAMIIQKITGQTWQGYVRQNLLRRAGLTDTLLFGDPLPAGRIAHGYIGDSAQTIEREDPLRLERPDSLIRRKYPIGAGGVFTTVDDLHKWWKALNSAKVLSDEARTKMFSMQIPDQGYGWNINRTNNEVTRIYRGGLRGSYQSLLAHYPKENVLLIFGQNTNNLEIGSWLSLVWNNVEKIIQGKEYVVPPAVTSTLVPPSANRFVGEYILPSADRFVVWMENGALKVGAVGQPAINALSFPTRGDVAAVADAGKDLVERMMKGEKIADVVGERERAGFEARWKVWTNVLGGVRSFYVLGVSTGSGGNPRTFIKLTGDKGSLVIRLLWNSSQRRLLAWGDDIQFPVVVKLLPESGTGFVGFDLERSQTVRLNFKVVGDKVTGLTVRGAGDQPDAQAVRTESLDFRSGLISIPGGGPAIPDTGPAVGKFAEFAGRFETRQGTLVFRPEGYRLVGFAGRDKIVLVPDPSIKDRFRAEFGGEVVVFQRDSGRRITGVTVSLGNGLKVRGRRTR